MELGFYREGTFVGLKLLFLVNVSFKYEQHVHCYSQGTIAFG